MIWIHGGSYTSGDGVKPIFPTSNNKLYDPYVMLRENVMVASLQYRLSTYGAIDYLGGWGFLKNKYLFIHLFILFYYEFIIFAVQFKF